MDSDPIINQEDIKNEEPNTEVQEEKEPSYDYFKNNTVIELAKFQLQNTSNQHYFKKTEFSPDSSCILTAANGKGLLVFETPADLYTSKATSHERDINILKPVIEVKTMSNIYDYCWYPLLNSQDPDSCFFLSSSQSEPIKLLDGFNGSYKCSYRIYDYADELDAALSVSFSCDGSLIFGGNKKGIAVFDVQKPGRDYDRILLNMPVSCLATSFENELAAGSWNKRISLIDTRDYLVTETLVAHKQGVTHLKFSSDGKYLASGSRKESSLLLWDKRNFSLPLYNFNRRVDNNQRICFDIFSNYLISGDTRGIVHVWNLNNLNEDAFPKESQYKLHEDSCSGVSVNPFFPILATSSGQFKIYNNNDDETDQPESIENSLVLWWIGDIDV